MIQIKRDSHFNVTGINLTTGAVVLVWVTALTVLVLRAL